MEKLFALILLTICCSGSLARTIAILSAQNEEPVAVLTLNDNGDESNQNSHQLVRQKRQFGRGRPFGQFGQSSAQANANAFNNNFGPNGFGSSNSNAGAQSFNSQGPLGGFGASAANAGSQGFNCGLQGCSGNAAQSGTQSYNLPGGKKVSIAYGNGFNFAPGQVPSYTNSNSISYV